jgi:2-polyprenyl-3-methyl-5-hydroxy-6-metoxy-1,4-benzoquinol methylase
MVKERYRDFASTGSSCCGGGPCSPDPVNVSAQLGYTALDLEMLPDGANLGLGCGAPVQHLALEAGEDVLDLGAGAGIDALIAARQVGPEGRVVGVDMTPEMVQAARRNAEAANIDWVEFRSGRLEALPLDDQSVDAVTSNCVINLVPDKSAVFREVARVLRPGGRLVVSDIILDGDLPDVIRDSVMAYVGCVAGAERRTRYFEILQQAGLTEVEILRDVDFLEITDKASPAEVLSLIEGAGIDRSEVAGVVRSVTYRAFKT